MNGFDLLRDALPSVPETDEGAKARARAILAEAIRAERASIGGRRPGTSAAALPKFDRRRRIVIAAAAIALILTAVALFLPATNPQRAAADEMQRLGTVAAGGPPVSVEPGSYLYTKLDIHGPQGQTMIGGPSFSLIVDEIEETWTANDGSRRRVTTVNASTFRSASDRQAWEKLGSPPIPQAGDVTTQTYRPGELGSFDVTDLPAAPHALEEAIHSGRVISEPAGEIGTFLGIADLLGQPNTPPDVRQGLFQLGSQLQGIGLDPSTIDPSGRPAEGLTLQVGSTEVELFVDPANSSLLAWKSWPQGGAPSWDVFLEGGVVPSDRSTP